MNKLDGLSPKFRGRVEAALERMGTDSELKALGDYPAERDYILAKWAEVPAEG